MLPTTKVTRQFKLQLAFILRQAILEKVRDQKTCRLIHAAAQPRPNIHPIMAKPTIAIHNGTKILRRICVQIADADFDLNKPTRLTYTLNVTKGAGSVRLW
jgi:hypothetical protein